MTAERSSRPIWLGKDERKWDHMRVHVQILQDRRLGANELAVYLGLVSHAEIHSGLCFPSLATLASYANIHRRTADRAMAVLVDAGYVRIEENPGRASTYFVLNPPALPSEYDASCDQELSTPLTESDGVDDGYLSTPLTESDGVPLTQIASTPDTDRDEQEQVTRTNQQESETDISTSVDNCDVCDDTGWVLDARPVRECPCGALRRRHTSDRVQYASQRFGDDTDDSRVVSTHRE